MDEVGQAKGIYFNYFIKAATAATKDQRRHLGILVAQAIAMASKMPSNFGGANGACESGTRCRCQQLQLSQVDRA